MKFERSMSKGSYFMKCTLMALVGFLAMGLATLLLWNWLVPSIFQGPTIDYLQALGLLVLGKLLSGGFVRGGYRGNFDRHSYWQRQMKNKLASLDPEEREAVKQRMKEKWCKWEKQSGDVANG